MRQRSCIEEAEMRLKDKVAIVTGASRGIGKAIAIALAAEGARVVVAARTEQEGGRLPGTIYSTVDNIQARGGKALAIRTDIPREDDVMRMAETTLREFGVIDILVNNAGIDSPSKVIDMPVKRWDLIMAVNLRGTFLCTRAVLPTMVQRRSGNIINLSSVAGTRLIALDVAYGTSKAAAERFTYGLAQEVKEYNIAVNALCPSVTDTEGVALWMPSKDKSGWQRPEMWGRYAVFLATQDAKSLTGRVLSAEEFAELGA
jgi:citronellol/citronellal dehydrogenase